MKVGQIVKVIGGNNEVGQPTMIGKTGVISSFGTEYKVKGEDTIEVFVEFEDYETHCFNDYHLEVKDCCEECFKWGKRYGDYIFPCLNTKCICHKN